jgi:hypothetical protein
MYQQFPLQGPPTNTQIRSFGMKNKPSGNPGSDPGAKNPRKAKSHCLQVISRVSKGEKLSLFPSFYYGVFVCSLTRILGGLKMYTVPGKAGVVQESPM